MSRRQSTDECALCGATLPPDLSAHLTAMRRESSDHSREAALSAVATRRWRSEPIDARRDQPRAKRGPVAVDCHALRRGGLWLSRARHLARPGLSSPAAAGSTCSFLRAWPRNAATSLTLPKATISWAFTFRFPPKGGFCVRAPAARHGRHRARPKVAHGSKSAGPSWRPRPEARRDRLRTRRLAAEPDQPR